uniref:Lachesin-like n=1 Tax=Crassostrea virginica TaxID=6565 RepID=A0A8B8E878_CRAVI|nr:lachesin-like [Crassostrea virginica]
MKPKLATQPTVRWSRLRPLPQSAIVNDAFLVIQSIRPQDAGTYMYVSTVQNVVGTVEKRVSLFVRAKPVITGGTESLTAALGSSASMACEAVGYPQPEISWYNMPRDYTVDKGMLEISRLYPGDQGTYVCQAQNDFGQNEKDNYYISVGGLTRHRCKSLKEATKVRISN